MEPPICRFCLKDGPLTSLFTTHPETSLPFASMLDFCASIQVDVDDGLPSDICDDCAKQLLGFYNFKKMLTDNEEKLRKSLPTEAQIKTDETESEGERDSGDKTTKFIEKKDTSRKLNECEICGTVLKNRSNYHRHKKTHSGGKPHVCDICEKTFTRSNDLKQHKKMHTGKNLIHCDLCDKVFIKSSNMMRHRQLHTEDKQYTCQLCHKCFHRETDLYTHIRFHTNDRPFQCETCGHSFVTSSDLTVHSRVHTGEKPFGCPKCDRRFVTRSHLNRHMKRHTNEECSVCGEGFVWKKELEVHMDTH